MQESYDRREEWVLGVTARASFMVALDTQVLTRRTCTLAALSAPPWRSCTGPVNAFNLQLRRVCC